MKSFSRVQLFATPWTVAYQAPPSMGFSRQEYWSGVPLPSPGDLPDPGINPGFQHCIQTLHCLSHQGRPGKCRDTTHNPVLVGKRNKNQQSKVNRLFSLKKKLIFSNEKATFLCPLSLLKFSSEGMYFPCPWIKTSVTLC